MKHEIHKMNDGTWDLTITFTVGCEQVCEDLVKAVEGLLKIKSKKVVG